MRAIALLVGVLVATPLMAAEKLIFYTASFGDATSVQLSVLDNSVSRNGDYDFDVAIGLVETSATGVIRYVDTGKHRARIRCSYPPYVSVGAQTYPIEMPLNRSARADWKENLWVTFCAAPSS